MELNHTPSLYFPYLDGFRDEYGPLVPIIDPVNHENVRSIVDSPNLIIASW
jgi:hypothetical protein